MNNQLIKNTKTSYTPGSPGYPAFAGQPWVPAHIVRVPRTIMVANYTYNRVFVPYTGLSGSSADGTDYGSQGGNVQPVWNADHTILLGYWVYMGSYFTGYTPQIVYDSVYYPEQPYIPPHPAAPAIASQTTIDLNLGWNSSGGSIASLQQDGWFEFRISTAAGIFVGFSEEYLTSGYMEIAFGIYFSRGTAQAYSYGVPQGTPIAYMPGNLFAVERFDGQFYCWHYDDGEDHAGTTSTNFYTSPSFDGTLFLVASIYSGGDFVYDPALFTEDFSGANVTIQPMASLSSDYVLATSSGSFLPLTSIARMFARANTSLPALRGSASNYLYGESRAVLPSLASVSESGMLIPGYAVAETMILPLLLASHGLTGEVGGADAILPRFLSLSSDHAYGESRAVLQPMEVICSAYEGATEASMHSLVGIINGWSVPTIAYLAWSETLGAAVAFTTDRVVDALYDEYADLGLVFSITAELGAQLMSTVQAGFATPLFDTAGNVWVVTPDGKTTRYEQFDYTGYAKINGRQYGVKADGVYLLEGDNDDGLPIQAAIGLGKQDFGTTLQKSVTACYLGVGSSGRMFMKIIANGQDYLYEARQDSETVMAQRVDPGKGLKATFMDFIVYNSGGADFELSSVEFVAIPLGRRI